MPRKVRLIALLLISLLPIGKVSIYRALFSAKIGRRVKIGFGAVLLFDELEIGNDCTISPFCLVRVKNAKIGIRCRIGVFTRIVVSSLTLGPSVTIGPQVSILAETGDPRCVFSAGAETWIFEYCYINPARPIRLGRNVGVGGGTYIFAHGLWLSALNGYPVTFGEVTIGDDVWLPWGCFILPGVEIGNGAVIGARSVVTKSVPPLALAAGMPAKIVKEKITREVSHDDKIKSLVETTEEFCSLNALECKIADQHGYVLLSFDGVLTVAIAKTPNSEVSSTEYGALLKVVPERLCDLKSVTGPIFSLASFQCSSRDTLNALQKAWLQHLRRIGTRHYPLDEVVVES